MWQLELLSRVVPAFGALVNDYSESEHHDGRRRDAEDCYADIVNIGQALYSSGGEWVLGLDDIDVTKLLTALETRFPKKPFTLGFAAWAQREVCPSMLRRLLNRQ